MKLKLRRIGPLQAGKILGAFYGLFSLLMIPFVLSFMALASMAAQHAGRAGAPPMPLMMGMGVGFAVCIPFIYAGLGFVFGALSAWIYNLLAGWFGGFELEFESPAPPTIQVPA